MTTLPAYRGHTDGDEVVWFREARVLYVGDYLLLDRFPIVDESGDLDGYLDNMAHLLRAFPADAVVVPGHGRFRPEAPEATDMAAFAWYHRLLRDSVDAIRAGLVASATADEIVKRGLGEPYRCWSDRPRYVTEERWIRYVARVSMSSDDRHRAGK